MRQTLAALLVVLLLSATPLAGEAQVAKTPRIGLLLPGSPSPEYERRIDAFRQGLREFGYIDKQNILLEYRWAHAKFDPIPDLIAELLSLPVDVLVIDGQRTAHAAKNATSTIPIVLALAGDVLQTGLVASLGRPGGNITGMTLMTTELGAKRLALLKEVVPKATRVAVLRNANNPSHQVYWQALKVAAPKLRVKLQSVEVRGSVDLERALATVGSGRSMVDGLLILEDPVLLPAFQTEIVDFAAKHRLPTLELLKEAVPAATRFGVLWNLSNQVHKPSLKIIEAAAQRLKVELHLGGVQDPKEIEPTMSALVEKRAQALVVFPDGMFNAQTPLIIALAARSRLPTMYGDREFAEAGGLMAYGVNFVDMNRHGASFVDKILKGAKPADLPVEQATKFELVINLKTAHALQLTIPQSLLQRADQIID